MTDIMEPDKQYLQKRDNDPPALGNFINWHIQQNKIKKKKVSDFLEILPTTLNRYFKQSSFQFAILWRVSQVTEHNFVMELGERLGIAYETKTEKLLKAQLAEKEKQIETLQIQLEVYNKIHKVG
ncbi:transcriptional regulator [Flavobacterium sp. WC2509]|uniref:transcriptional regulator n=1 Tax=Flavobacterium sp. WC2509 TaxID=3461406 RepID=UPI004044196E